MRKRLAALFYEAGMTMAQIGAMPRAWLPEKTISRDLRRFWTSCQN